MSHDSLNSRDFIDPTNPAFMDALHQDTARWTSPSYHIQFATVRQFDQDDNAESAFDLSAWGLSRSLRDLLQDYSERDLREAVDWTTTHQNRLVAEILEAMASEARQQGRGIPPLDTVFITVEADLYLPRGLRMSVACVTNIVPLDNGDDSDGLNKFVAVLDPGEAQAYIDERSGMDFPDDDPILH